MFVNKLRALDFPGTVPDKIDHDSPDTRNLWLWLEQNKLHHWEKSLFKLAKLSHTADAGWKQYFEEYLRTLECPWSLSQSAEVTEWLLRKCVELDYGQLDCRFSVSDDLKRVMILKGEATKGKVVEDGHPQASSLDGLSGDSEEMRQGLSILAGLLGVSLHGDSVTSLKVISGAIDEAIHASDTRKEGDRDGHESYLVPLQDIPLGFECADAELEKGLKITRLLHIRQLRKLQTQCDEALVALQRLTADPKTDDKLGKVGRF